MISFVGKLPFRMEIILNVVAFTSIEDTVNAEFVICLVETACPLKTKSAFNNAVRVTGIMGGLNHVTSPPNNFAGWSIGLSRRKKCQREQKEDCPNFFHLLNRVYFTPNFCLSQDMDAQLPPLTAS